MTSVVFFDFLPCMLVLLTSKVDGTAYCHQEVDKDWSDSYKPDVPWIAEGEGLISSSLRTVDQAVADVAGTDFVLSIGVTEEEVPRLRPSMGHLCVTPAGAQDCHYDSSTSGTYQSPLVVTCCCDRCDTSMTCALDSTTGFRLWQLYAPQFTL